MELDLLVIFWLSPLDVLAKREQSTYGEPYRDTPRTSEKKSGATSQTEKLANTVYNILKAQAFAEKEDTDASGSRSFPTSPRPQVPDIGRI